MDVQAILESVAASAGSDELVFPTTTDMALKVQRVLDDPDCSIDQLAKLVQADPLLAARVVAVANSATYNRSGRAIADVRNAVSRLGFNTLRVLAAAVVVRQMEGMARTPGHRELAVHLWHHTAHVAALAQVIARRFTHVDPDTTFFAGIIHEVGAFYLISRAVKYPGLLEAEHGALLAWEEGGAALVGRAVLKRLGAPAPVMEAIEGMWQGYLAMPPQSLADTLLLADCLAPLESPLSQLAGKGREGTEARIDIALDDKTLSSMLEESAAEVDSLIGALQS
ncbi:HDOD domain-containing protein [Sulfuritalea sp.]|uniref:HDOD domain-containing protein n=1 Tax=Sulfuritalea sp. TaxID=2480090 RepID=UPI001AD2C611|nr:HDOD domain-containing protein [Sulfuritalea sp.]MBN8473730.1 HDOD domain-containing protein [Sulfuritalea sp.]